MFDSEIRERLLSLIEEATRDVELNAESVISETFAGTPETGGTAAGDRVQQLLRSRALRAANESRRETLETTLNEAVAQIAPGMGQLTSQAGDAGFQSLSRVIGEVAGGGTQGLVPQILNAASEPRASNSGATSILSPLVKNVFGLAPLVSGLVRLFSRGDEPAAPPVEKYRWPAAVQLAAGISGAGWGEIDYGQGDLPRLIQAVASERAATEVLQQWEGAPAVWRDTAVSGEPEPGRVRYATAEGPPKEIRRDAPQITVQVQALDSRSFLDRSEDIARAVRQAMLDSNTLNDVIGEL